MSTRSADSREHSPEDAQEKRASKKRKVLSCYACRNRKMKCDRVYPVCSRCQKTGRADQCTYDPRLLEDLSINGDGHVDGGASLIGLDNSRANHSTPAPVPTDSLAWKIRAQERRIEALERKLDQTDVAKNLPPSHYDDFDLRTDVPATNEERMFRGKAFKTQFYGSTSIFSILGQFSELQSFTREAFLKDGAVLRIRNDFRTFRDKRKAATKEKGVKTQASDEDVFALVPPKPIVDAQVSLYLQTFETSYRIVHEPTFWRDYHAFWERRPGDEASASFATILVLIIAITKCIVRNDGNVFIGDSSADRELAAELIETCDAWLLHHSRKHLTVQYFQMQCLSILGKRVNCLKCKQDWANSGDLMRTALASGLHRDPSFVVGGRITEFEKEIRKRIWVTIMELELQSSIDRGLPSSLCGLYFDSPSPANIPDDCFSYDSQQIPASRPIEHFTTSAYLNATMRSLPLRIHLTQILNNPTSQLNYDDIHRYSAQITSALTSLPSWDDPRALIPFALLNLQLRQFLIVLHRPYANLASANPRFVYSLTACVDAASSILSLHNAQISAGSYMLSNIRNDILRTGITLAQVVYRNCDFTIAPPEYRGVYRGEYQVPGSVPTDDNTTLDNAENSAPQTAIKPPQIPELKIPQLPSNNFLLTTLCTTAIALLEKAQSSFEHKVMRLGTGYMEYWLLSASIGNMPSTESSHQPSTSIASLITSPANEINARIRNALDRIASLCFKVIAMQKDPGNMFASSLRSTMAAASESDGRTPPSISSMPPPFTPGTSSASFSTFIPGPLGLSAALEEGKGFSQGAFDSLHDMQVDLADWTFPDFWADIGGNF